MIIENTIPLTLPPIILSMVNKWPSAIVARSQVGKFTGGLIAPKTLANLDSKGEGPSKRVRVGSQSVGYPVDEFCLWLAKRMTVEMAQPKVAPSIL